MRVHPLIGYAIGVALIALGGYGAAVRRSTILLLAALELLLAGVTLILVTADLAHGDPAHRGQVAALFVLALAAAEIGVGLALILRLHRARGGAADALDVTTIDAPPYGEGEAP